MAARGGGGVGAAVGRFVVLALLASQAAAWSLPGVAPKSYSAREAVPLAVGTVTSTRTQMPYLYDALPFCKSNKAEGGDQLAGDSDTESLYAIEMKVHEACKIVCRKQHTKQEMKMFQKLIDSEYRISWYVDSLPAATQNDDYGGCLTRGFPVGSTVPPAYDGGSATHFLYNHLRIVLHYHESPTFEGARIVGFEVQPFSVRHEWDGDYEGSRTMLKTCNEMHAVAQGASAMQAAEMAQDVVYSYDVQWTQSSTPWAQRWDVYLRGDPDDEMHYFSIVNSLMIVLFLTGVVAVIMLRTLRRDISTYNEMQLEEAAEESGWKLLHGDVFRPPPNNPMLLATLAGTGCQLLAMTLCTAVFALLGFLSPANRGDLLTALLLLFVATGGVNGYCTATLYKLFKGRRPKQAAALAATLYPGVSLAIFGALELLLQRRGSSTAGVRTTVSLLALWAGVSAPLVLAGAHFGADARPLEPPTRVSQIPRHVPQQAWYAHPVLAVAFGGVLPFGAVCVELFFIMSALWLHQIYYVFGFLVAVLLILVATCAEMTIVMVYFQLCGEDYNWWWRAFLSSGSAAGYLFLYSVWYFHSKLDIVGGVPAAVYFGHMAVIALTFFLLCGAVGFYASLAFVLKIYACIKSD